jgi:superfamily II DNA or RNA helicase
MTLPTPALRARKWGLRYSRDDGDMVAELYLPLLSCAVRYDRLTGYFTAGALALAARGLDGLVRNGGVMRLVVGCTLNPAEVQAILDGEALRTAVQAHLAARPLNPPDPAARHGLELLAWMVADGRLQVKVAVPCDAQRRPVADPAIFHEKAGVVEDAAGDRVAFHGSLNETAAGWTQNFESLTVFQSWAEPDRVAQEEAHFARLWAGQSPRAVVMDVPQAAREDLLRFLPDPGELPARLRPAPPDPEPPPEPAPVMDLRAAVWSFIAQAPRIPGGGARVGEATCAVTPWPHQVRAFHRMYDNWPPRLLIGDEVGLGKTIQAGLLLRQAWLAGRAHRILILAPKAVLRQWQVELREKFNLNWPIYDGQKFCWYPSPAMHGRHERTVARTEWHREPVVIASSHLMRRRDRIAELLGAEPWDLVVLDEAHHARRRGAGSQQEGGPNALLRLMHGLRSRTQGLVLLTATPMQVHPVEVWDLLDLLGLPAAWSERAFLTFFEDAAQANPSHDGMDRMSALFRAVEGTWGPVDDAAALQSLGLGSGLRARKVLRALRDPANVPRRQLEANERRAAVSLMRRHTPVSRLISRNTRELLREYQKTGRMQARIAVRDVQDRFIQLSEAERAVYEAVEYYILTTYQRTTAAGATAQERNAVGFVMTIYRRRVASSFHALRQTLAKHLAAMDRPAGSGDLLAGAEDVDEDELDAPDEDEAEAMARRALAADERAEIRVLMDAVDRLPPDTKAAALRGEIAVLRAGGYGKVMVFTQFTDTMDALRAGLVRNGERGVICFSGRGGEVPSGDGTWRTISRDEVKRRFREGRADVMLCTDAAAEGLNFQFCGALVNYDCPWNPMRIEQRIGRIDRLGQQHEHIRIVNLHLADTVEADVYTALRNRIGLFERVVGGLQPILARLPGLVCNEVLGGRPGGAVGAVELAADAAGSFDLNDAASSELDEAPRPPSPVVMADLDRIVHTGGLLPSGMEMRPLGRGEYGLSAPGQVELRVTTDTAFYEAHSDSVELWSPGGAAFPSLVENDDVLLDTFSLGELLR